VPYNSLIDRTGATALIPEEASREIIKEVPHNSMVMQLGRRLPNMSRAQRRMAVLNGLISANWVDGDTGQKQTSEVEWANTYIYAEELAVIVPIPINVLSDADYDIWGEVTPLIREAFGVAFDAAVLKGTNAPAAFPDDIMTAVVAKSHTVDHSSVSGDYFDEILGTAGVVAMIEADGYDPSGYVAPIQTKAALRGLRIDAGGGAGTGEPLFMRNRDGGATMQGQPAWELDGAPVLFDRASILNSSTETLIVGDWSKLVWAMREDLSYSLHTDGVVQDNSGAIVYNLMQQDMVALRAVMRLGWALPNPINRANQTAATRYPFAAIIP
jgi:HK97 family phage major capsid protein